MNRKALDHCLKKELLANMRELHFMHGGRCHPCHLLLEEARHSLIGNYMDSSTIPRKDVNSFLSFYLNAKRESISSIYVDQAVYTDAYLTYDEAADDYTSNELSDGLVTLKKSYDAMAEAKRTILNNETLAMLLGALQLPQFTVENTRMAPLLNLYNVVKNVISYSRGVVLGIEGDLQTLKGLTPMPVDSLQRDGQLTFDRPKPGVIDQIVKGTY